MKLKLILRLGTLLTMIFGCQALFAQVAGVWSGTLEVAPGNALEVHFTIVDSAEGGISVTLNSPESGAIKDVKANSASFSNNILKVDVTDLSGTFEGTLADGKISGNWKQLDQSLPLVLAPFEETVLGAETVALIEGRWQGIFEPPGQQVNVALTVSSPEPGKVKAEFEQLDAANKVQLPDFKIEGDTITFHVGPNGPKYTGTVSGDNINGTIQAGSISFPGNLSRREFNPRDYALDLSDEAEALLMGKWHGEMTTPLGPVAAVFRFEEVEPDFIRGYFDSPDRGATDIPISEVTLDGKAIAISLGGNRGFTGTVADNGNLEGDFSQQGQKLPVTLTKGSLPPLALDIASAAQSQLLGNWQGKLTTPGGVLTIGLRFEKAADGSLVAYLDSPDQGMAGARIREASFNDGSLTVRSNLLRIVYEGSVAGNTITGKLAQGGQNLDLVLTKTN